MRKSEKPLVIIKSSLTVRGIGVAVQNALYAAGLRVQGDKAFSLAMNSYGREDCIKKLSKFVTLEER